MIDECIECGGITFHGALRCEDCDFEMEEQIVECTSCGNEFDHNEEGEYDTCGACLSEFEDAA